MPSKRKSVQKHVKVIGLEVVDPDITGLVAKPLQDYEKEMEVVVRKGIIPGCCSLVYHKGKVVQAFAMGMADVEHSTPFTFNTFCRMYCATKPFIATAVMRFVEEGRATLDDRLSDYIPELATTKVKVEKTQELVEPKRPILLRHLLCHLSGIGYAPEVGEPIEDDITQAYWDLQHDVQRKKIKSLTAFTRALAKIPLCDHPGNEYIYGFSFDVLGRVLEVIGGKSLDKVLNEKVFQPLKMQETKWALNRGELPRLAACYAHRDTWKKIYSHRKPVKPVRPNLVRIDGEAQKDSHWLQGQQCSLMSGGGFMGYLYGGLVSTVLDTGKFVQMLMKKGVMMNGKRFLKASTVAQMEKNRIRKGDKVNFLGNIGTYRHGHEYGMGGAACTYWSIDREDETAAVWFTQHVDMPEVEEMKGVHHKKADLWAMLHKAVKETRRRSQKRRSNGVIPVKKKGKMAK